MDETLIYLNMPTSTTVQTIGSWKVNIRTQGIENGRITVILIIISSREKLAPLLILKEKEGKDLERKLQQIECVDKKNFRILEFWQENSWNS